MNYLVKPAAPAVLLTAAAKALTRGEAVPGPAQNATEHDIVGETEAILRVRHMVALASRSDVNVMIVGETGTGKELVARAVHRLSARTTRGFVAHNCARTPQDLFDAEFFGHVRGSFTGAHRNRQGLLRQADRGVLFLDEIECLSLPNQAKLLRVIDDGEVRSVGSEHAIAVSVRYVTATNRSPEVMLAAGELREDFYYRLRGFEIRLPPLRERLEDVPLLGAHFLGATGKQLAAASVEALQRCLWPGNVRQLKTALQCAVVRAPGKTVEVSHLDLDIAGGLGGASSPPAPSRSASERWGAGVRLDVVEREAILRALALHGGNRSRAARALGIHRSTLLRRLRELEIDPSVGASRGHEGGGK